MSSQPSPSELSFLPEDYLERRARRRANVLCGALSVLVMGAIGSAFAIGERSMRGLDARAAEVDRLYDEQADRLMRVRRLRDQQQMIVRHAELAATLVEKVPRSNILAELTNSLPPGTSLLDFALETVPHQAPPAPAGTIFEQKKQQIEQGQKAAAAAGREPETDVKMRLAGVADNDVQVAQFISKLNVSKLLRDVNLVISDTFQQEKNTLRRFQIEMTLNPEAEVRCATVGVAGE